MKIIKDNPKQTSWKALYNRKYNIILTGDSHTGPSTKLPEDWEFIPNPVFVAKFKVNDIFPTASSIGVILKECDCPVLSTLKDDFSYYHAVGKTAKKIILDISNGVYDIVKNKGWFEATFTLSKRGNTYNLEFYEE